jgi:outer membrane beta-barrel protein
LAYYFNDRWGVQLNYAVTNTQDNQAVQRLQGQLGYPDHNQIQNFYGAQVDWVPFYAKMSVLNWAIIYFDLQFALGAGMQTYSQQKIDGNTSVSTPALTFDVTQSFFLNKHFAVRVDLSNRWYSETTVKYNVAPTGGHISNGSDTTNATFLLLGLTLFY